MQRTGLDAIIVGYWWALAEVVKRCPEVVGGFRRLAKRVLFDFTYYDSGEAAFRAIVQLLESAEEMREHFGFSGMKKVEVVVQVQGMLKNGGMRSSLRIF